MWIHASLLLVALLALIPLIDNGEAAVPDEGVYLAQASNLRDGSWSSLRPAPEVDPDGVFDPVNDGGIDEDRVTPYTKHPLYPLLLVPGVALGGTAGALTLSALGTWAAAVGGALIARRLSPAYGPWSLWLIGIGSPLLFDAYIAVAHSIAAACAAFAFLGASRAVDDRRWIHLIYALPATAALVALRGEGLVFCGALAAVVGLRSLGWPPLRRIDWSGVVVSVSLGATGLLTVVAESWAVGLINPADGVTTPIARLPSDAIGPLDGIWASLLRPFAGSWADAQPYLPLAVLGLTLAALVLRFFPSQKLFVLVALVGSATASVGLVFTSRSLITGLIPVFPLLFVGLISLRRRDFANKLVARATSVSAVTAVAIIATNYSVGGAAEWGGRFFHILLPVLAPIIVRGCDNARCYLSNAEAWIAGVCIFIITASISFAAIATLQDARRYVHDLRASAVTYARAQDLDLLVLSKLRPDGSGRFFWSSSTDPDVLTSYDLRNLHRVLRSAQDAGYERIGIVTDINPLLFSTTLDKTLDAQGWKVLDTDISPLGVVGLVTVGEPEA